MVELMKLYKERKEREFKKVVNSPFTAYRMKHKFRIYQLKQINENPGKVEFIPIEGGPKPFDREFPSNKEIYRIHKRVKSEKAKLLDISCKIQANFEKFKKSL